MPLVYDVYGTLLDVDAATRLAAAEPGMDVLVKGSTSLGALAATATGAFVAQQPHATLSAVLGYYRRDA